MENVKKLFFILFLVFLSSVASAQLKTDSVITRIETRDGNQFTGELISQDSSAVQIQTRLGILTISRSDIISMKEVEINQIRDGQLWMHNPQASRYLWSPNGYSLKRGEGYYQNIWIFWNQVAYGLTDHFSIGGALIPLFLFGGAPTPVFLTAKFSIPVKPDKFNIGLGAMAGAVIGEADATFSLLYGIGTYGSPDNNFSAGIGYGFSGDGFSSPTINLGGMTRISNRWYLLTENYIFPSESFVLLSFGARSMIKTAALDFGLIFPTQVDSFIGIPWLGFTVPFGNQIR